MVARPVSNVFYSGRKEVFKVRLASGREVEATANHPFLAFDGWTPLGELTVGDRVAVPRPVPEPVHTARLPDDEVVLVAHTIGDGGVARGAAERGRGAGAGGPLEPVGPDPPQGAVSPRVDGARGGPCRALREAGRGRQRQCGHGGGRMAVPVDPRHTRSDRGVA